MMTDAVGFANNNWNLLFFILRIFFTCAGNHCGCFWQTCGSLTVRSVCMKVANVTSGWYFWVLLSQIFYIISLQPVHRLSAVVDSVCTCTKNFEDSLNASWLQVFTDFQMVAFDIYILSHC